MARITINRAKVYNAFRPRTCEELIDAFKRASWNKDIGAIVFGGAGDKARGNPARQRHVIEIIDKIYASSASGAAQEIGPV